MAELRRLVCRPLNSRSVSCVLALHYRSWIDRQGPVAFLAVYRSFFDALVMKLFRFDVWMDSYNADIFVDKKVIPDFSPGSVSNTWRPLSKAEITRFWLF